MLTVIYINNVHHSMIYAAKKLETICLTIGEVTYNDVAIWENIVFWKMLMTCDIKIRFKRI